MRLEKIKLAGFKSFVDPTPIAFPSNLVGVVGPNGCGKSNIIDAIRWVMGESSAKQLRGELLVDVIFNGSTERKPIGQASIELIFDNSSGTIGGEYAKYSQIAVRRQVNREGQSIYFVNNMRCRRRDVTDIFLGTGLGPRSYAIIEQGMIAKFIESKPEELRSHLEEVAGISKYKERRRETENRIKATKENLNRISDLREELGKQLDRLKRQARAAERYKVLKEEERLLKAQLLAIKWQLLDSELTSFSSVINQHTTILESHHAQLQHIDTEIEKEQIAKVEFGDEFNSVQNRYYAVGNEIARLEQSIEHQKERYQQLELDLQQTESAWESSKEALEQDKSQLEILSQKITEVEPTFKAAEKETSFSQELLHNAEKEMRDWQHEWDEFNALSSKASETARVEQTRMEHLEQQQIQATVRIEKIEEEKRHLTTDQETSELEIFTQNVQKASLLVEEKQSLLSVVVKQINEQRQKNHDFNTDLHNLRNQLQGSRGRYASLEALQQAALGHRDGALLDWLDRNELKKHPRLAHGLTVEKGWEQAVETVLGKHLEAVCVEGVDAVAALLDSLEEGHLSLFDITMNDHHVSSAKRETLSSKIQSKWGLKDLLDGVYVVNTLNEALTLRDSLLPHESVITPEGIWLGRKWLRVSKTEDEKSGMLKREQELQTLSKEIEEVELSIQNRLESLKEGEESLSKLEYEREQLQLTLSQAKTHHANISAKLHVKEAEIEQITRRKTHLEEEESEHQHVIERAKKEKQEAERSWGEALKTVEAQSIRRGELLRKRDEYRNALDQASDKARQDRDRAHELELQLQSYRSRFSALEQAIDRIQLQLGTLIERREKLAENLEKGSSPDDHLQTELNMVLEKRVLLEKDLMQARKKVEGFEDTLKKLSQKRHHVEAELESSRDALEEKRLQHQELKVRRTTLQEQLVESQFKIETLLNEMPEEATEESLSEQVERTAVRISRLGPINLAAIDEYDEASKRKEYLDAQNTDLEEALETLHNAIRKIDKETRSRFKETFDSVNNIFQNLFPRVFGGGKAYLELTGEDLLDTGVSLMASPPGKRISSIHLLSGGEKALTAIALVFSLFQLNPAPFCLLDEVDAPLDDVNVRRFCDLVKEMSKKVQFIFISHNKLAFEMANHLMGVTMNEPGVSRIVSVDVDEAVTISEAS